MNNIDESIFNNYATVETALLNALATEVRTKGKKARVLKGEGYYVKYDGEEYDITAEQCRIYKLIRNNYDMFAEQLNSAKSDMLGVWKNVWGDRLPVIIADLERGIEICQKYFDAFKSFITEGGEDETVEENDEKNEEATVASETTTDETVAVENGTESGVVTTSENETSTEECETTGVNAHNFEEGSYKEAQNREHPTAPRGGSLCAIKNGS